MVYDTFLYNGEFKMLRFRLNELDHYVDKFIILESDHTFKGDQRHYHFPIDKDALQKFLHKIVFVRHYASPHPDPWVNERNQRRCIEQGFQNEKLSAKDIIILSDLDEIPDLNFLSYVRKHPSGFSGIVTCYQNYYYYNIHCRNKQKWCGPVIFSYGSGLLKMGFDKIRDNKDWFHRIGKDGDFNSGGWHLSYFGDPEFIINKIRSFSHQEFNRPEFTNPMVIKDCITKGKDLFFRKGEEFEIVENQTYLPKHISLLE